MSLDHEALRLECLRACGGVIPLAERAWRFVSAGETIRSEQIRLDIVRVTRLDEFDNVEVRWSAALSFVEGADA